MAIALVLTVQARVDLGFQVVRELSDGVFNTWLRDTKLLFVELSDRCEEVRTHAGMRVKKVVSREMDLHCSLGAFSASCPVLLTLPCHYCPSCPVQSRPSLPGK